MKLTTRIRTMLDRYKLSSTEMELAHTEMDLAMCEPGSPAVLTLIARIAALKYTRDAVKNRLYRAGVPAGEEDLQFGEGAVVAIMAAAVIAAVVIVGVEILRGVM